MPADTCGLVPRGEFKALTGRPEYAEPEGMALGEGSVCGFGNGPIVPLPDEGSAAAFKPARAGVKLIFDCNRQNSRQKQIIDLLRSLST